MPQKILSTKIVENDGEYALIELVISEGEAEDTACETLHIRTRVQVRDDSYLPALQISAINRAKALFDEIEKSVRLKWTPK